MKTLINILLAFIISIGTLSGQTTWHPIESGTNQDVRCINFVDNTIGYAAGDHVLLKTTNGGLTWQEVQIDSIDTNTNEDWYAYDIQFFTENHGRMMLGEWGGLVETFNGGLNWSLLTPASSGFCRFGSFYFFDADNGFAGGAGCFESAIIDKYENGTWITTSIPGASNWDGTNDLVRNMDFYDSGTGIACTDGGRILRTVDGGQTWDSISSPLPELHFTDIAFLTADTLYATYAQLGGFGVLISLDAGLTWEVSSELATFFYPLMNAVHVDGLGRPYIGGLNGNDQSTGVIFDNADDPWNLTALVFPIHDIDSHSDSIVFLVGDSGSIYVNVDPVLLSVNDLDPAIILHVYPNPAEDWINISVNARRHEILDVRLFDLQGKELDIEWTSTDYGIPVMLDSIPTGQYLIEVRTVKGRNMSRFQKE